MIKRRHLSELRREAGMTQVAVGKAADLDPSQISRVERGSLDAHRVGTVRRYVEALGGRLDVWVVIEGRRIPLAGVLE